MLDKGLFWSYDSNIAHDESKDIIFMEYLLEYDFYQNKFTYYSYSFFGMNIEINYFKKTKNERFDKFKLFAF